MKRRASASCAARCAGSISCIWAEAGDGEPALGELPLDVAETRRRELGCLAQVHRRLKPAQLDGAVAVRGGEVQDLDQRPRRATQRRETERQPHPLTPSPFRRGGTLGVPPLPKGEGTRG